MPRNGITKQRIVETAAALIEQSGIAAFSMHRLAQALDIQTASLYHHVRSMDALLVDVCAHALHLQLQTALRAIDGKTGQEAIFALANACRRFARTTHRELYRLILRTAVCDDPMTDASRCIVEPFMQVLKPYHLPEEAAVHWQRILRALIHGFVAQEEAGFFSHLPGDAEQSFQVALQCYIDGLTQAEKRYAP